MRPSLLVAPGIYPLSVTFSMWLLSWPRIGVINDDVVITPEAWSWVFRTMKEGRDLLLGTVADFVLPGTSVPAYHRKADEVKATSEDVPTPRVCQVRRGPFSADLVVFPYSRRKEFQADYPDFVIGEWYWDIWWVYRGRIDMRTGKVPRLLTRTELWHPRHDLVADRYLSAIAGESMADWWKTATPTGKYNCSLIGAWKKKLHGAPSYRPHMTGMIPDEEREIIEGSE
jgi:hypothetical protein